MFRKVVLSTTAVVFASSMALAGPKAERNKGFPGAEPTVDNAGNTRPRTSLEKLENFHQNSSRVDKLAARQALIEIAEKAPSAREFADKIAELRLTKLGNSEGMKRLDAVLDRELANFDVKTIETNGRVDDKKIKKLLDKITREALKVDAEEFVLCKE
jgi:hypothetical protein